MCIASVAVIALHYTLDKGLESVKETMFVEAGADLSFEQDDFYNDYFASAQLQSDLMKEKNKKIQTWSFEHYKKF